jgi:hypothetical protein
MLYDPRFFTNKSTIPNCKLIPVIEKLLVAIILQLCNGIFDFLLFRLDILRINQDKFIVEDYGFFNWHLQEFFQS